jgi:hypothetical protein
MPYLWNRRAAAILVTASITLSAFAQDPEKPKETAAPREARGKWAGLFQKHADEYKVRVGESPREAVRLDEPVLRWLQPIRGGDDGALYLWVADGRPVAAITFFTFKWPEGPRAIIHEKHSLALSPVEAEWRGETVWHSPRAGLKFQPVADAPAPAATPAARLRQLQAIARDVSAVTTDDKGSNWPLRVLAKPLYRYDAKAGVDGALFALAQGTDPEAFLLIEARESPSGPRWEIAAARFTDLKIRVLHKGVELYSGPNTTGRSDDVYHSTTALQKTSEDPNDFR